MLKYIGHEKRNRKKRQENFFKKMWKKIPLAKKYYSDGYEVYAENFSSNRLEVGKRGINRNESLHPVFLKK